MSSEILDLPNEIKGLLHLQKNLEVTVSIVKKRTRSLLREQLNVKSNAEKNAEYSCQEVLEAEDIPSVTPPWRIKYNMFSTRSMSNIKTEKTKIV